MSELETIAGFGTILFCLSLAIYMYKYYYEKEH